MTCTAIYLFSSLAPMIQGNGKDKENVCVSYDFSYVTKTQIQKRIYSLMIAATLGWRDYMFVCFFFASLSLNFYDIVMLIFLF